MSVPLPAIVVATVTAPSCPAPLIISASQNALLAFNTLCGIFSVMSSLEKTSVSVAVFRIISTGCSRLCASIVILTAAMNSSRAVTKYLSRRSILFNGLFGGITTTLLW